MSTAVTEQASKTGTRTTTRTEALAQRLEAGARALAELAASLTDAQWNTPIPHDGRRVGVVVHHVASVYPVEIQLAQLLAEGQPVAGVTFADVDAMNGAHAQQFAATTKEEAIALLRANSAAAAAAIRELGDEQLDRANTNSMYGDAPLTCQHMLEDHAVRHSYHHLAKIRKALGKA